MDEILKPFNHLDFPAHFHHFSHYKNHNRHQQKISTMFFIKKILPVIIVFVFINLLILTSFNTLATFNISNSVLLGSNLFFFLLSLISIAIQNKALSNKNPNAFIRSIMVGMIMKMFSTAIAVVVYFFQSGIHFNKRGVFISLLFYLIYLATEVITMIKLNKKNNG